MAGANPSQETKKRGGTMRMFRCDSQVLPQPAQKTHQIPGEKSMTSGVGRTLRKAARCESFVLRLYDAPSDRLNRRADGSRGRRTGDPPGIAARHARRLGSLTATVAAFALLAARLPGPAMAQSFPLGPPNDPSYEPQGTAPGSCSAHQNQFYLWSFIPSCFPNATDPENAAGMSVDLAWKKTTGKGMVIA